MVHEEARLRFGHDLASSVFPTSPRMFTRVAGWLAPYRLPPSSLVLNR